MTVPQAQFSSKQGPTQEQGATAPQGPLDESIRYVKGVGPGRLAQLAQLGVATIREACFLSPRRYEDRTRLAPIREVRPGETVTVQGEILSRSLRRARRGMTIVEISLGDGTGVLYATWFHQPYLAQQLTVGEQVILYGTVEPNSRLQMIHPELELVEPGEEGSIHVGRIVPIYPLVAGISQRWLRQTIATVLERASGLFEEALPRELLRRYQLPGITEAIKQFHYPSSWEALAKAEERLAFEELLLFQIGLAQRRERTRQRTKPQTYRLDGPLTSGLIAQLPFTLTTSQQQVMGELMRDLDAPSPMHRLLQGDVGCGKTIVMVALMAVAVQSGYQVALMAPTELLAEQHARTAAKFLGPLGVSTVLVSQGVPPEERRKNATRIARGEVSVVIGTHALIQRDVVFAKLSLVIIDEQHKFGVVQRATLAKKSQVPDVLVVTATPIPRTLALTLYGDLEVSTILQMPPGRGETQTRWLKEADRARLYQFVREELTQGRQGYIVYPLVDEGATKELKAATSMAKRLQTEVFPEFRVGLLHGQMKPAQKEATMLAFATHEIDLLVSTVIIEVGIDVPNATVMVIEHPERFGLAQLHQLRGRIGRSEHPARCLVVSDSADSIVTDRLEAFVGTRNGFELAEKDMDLRGPGELRGSQQSGWLRFRIANLQRDRALLERARDEAVALVHTDPELTHPDLAILRQQLTRSS